MLGVGVTASHNYEPKDLIYTEEAFVKVLPRQLKNIACESCSEKYIFLKTCIRCRAVKYCGKECQKNDWSSHKLECLHLKNLPEHLLEGNHVIDFCRLVGIIILKIKDKDWKNIKKCVMGIDFSFDDMHSHHEIMMENRHQSLFCKELKENLTIFIGKENMPNDIVLMKIIGKVVTNTIIRKSLYFFIGISKFKLECIPNAQIELEGKSLRMSAIKKINKGIDEITVPSRQIFKWVKKELEFLNYACKCSDCSLPYGESVLTKIIDDKKAFSVICETEIFLDAVALFSRIEDQFQWMKLRETVDKLLRRQEGVLGSSNILRLRLLGLGCLKINNRHPLIIRKHLLELEKNMREVFGEHYWETELISDALFDTEFKFAFDALDEMQMELAFDALTNFEAGGLLKARRSLASQGIF